MRHHDTKNRNTARTTVQELMTKPAATIYLQQHVDKARGKIVELLDKGKDEIQLRAAQDILDREYGKAKQTTEVTSTGISLNIDLTSALTEAD